MLNEIDVERRQERSETASPQPHREGVVFEAKAPKSEVAASNDPFAEAKEIINNEPNPRITVNMVGKDTGALAQELPLLPVNTHLVPSTSGDYDAIRQIWQKEETRNDIPLIRLENGQIPLRDGQASYIIGDIVDVTKMYDELLRVLEAGGLVFARVNGEVRKFRKVTRNKEEQLEQLTF